MEPDWHVLPDAGQLARNVAQKILVLADSAITQRGVFKIVLAGGKTPVAVYRILAAADSDWGRWRVYFGDERCLPPEDPERNSVMAAENWLQRVAMPGANVFAIPAELGPDRGAADYTAVIAQARPFDLVLLGMGEDGHTASLFPGQAHDPEALVHGIHDAPKPPPERVSLGLAALNDAREVMVLITGASKHNAVRDWLNGKTLPVTQVHGHCGAKVYVDGPAYTNSGTWISPGSPA